jgi:hypothetical protein
VSCTVGLLLGVSHDEPLDRCFPSQDFTNKYRNVVEPFWRKGDQAVSFTDEQMAEARYTGTVIKSGETYQMDATVLGLPSLRHTTGLTHNPGPPQCSNGTIPVPVRPGGASQVWMV